MGFVIKEMFAFVAIDPGDAEGDEGVLGFQEHGGSWIPMVGADLKRVESLRPVADEMAKQLGITYKIKKFIYTEDL